MGLLDSLKGLISGSGKVAVPVTLDAGEVEVARVVACTVKGAGRPWVGGDLVLTNRRILFLPLNTNDVAALLSYGLKRVGASAGATAVGWVQNHITPAARELPEIESAGPNRSASILNPPTISVSLRDGRTLEFGILAGRMAPNSSSANERVRNQFLIALQNSV